MWKKDNDWFWEGNVQEKLVAYFENLGYAVTKADTLSKSRGIDISAIKGNREILVEVKGYPSDKYADGEKQGQLKKTQPTLQAKHWFSEVLLSAIQRKTKSQQSTMVIGLPEFKRYLSLIEDTRWALKKLEIRVLIVKSTGEVYEP